MKLNKMLTNKETRDMFNDIANREATLMEFYLRHDVSRSVLKDIGNLIKESKYALRLVLKVEQGVKPEKLRRGISRNLVKLDSSRLAQYTFQTYILRDVLLRSKRALVEQKVGAHTRLSKEQKLFLSQVEQQFAALKVLKDHIVSSNMRLVTKLALDKKSQGDLDDLIQEGAMGLMHAVDKYDVRKGYVFSTYAYNWIKTYMSRYRENHGRVIRLPVKIQERLTTMRIKTVQLAQVLGVQPTIQQISEAMNMDVRQLNKLIQKAEKSEVLLTDNPIPSKRSVDLSATLSDFQQSDIAGRFGEVLDTLSPSEELLLRQRIGLNGVSNRDVDSAGMLLGVSKYRVKQLEWVLYMKLKHPSRTKLLWEYFI